MTENRTSISQANSDAEVGEFWDSHDLGDSWDLTHPVAVRVDLKAEKSYFSVARDLANQIEHLAHAQGVSSGTLVNLWLQEKVHQTGS
jgi:hypothetical protein